jgi:hypothetical protein
MLLELINPKPRRQNAAGRNQKFQRRRPALAFKVI